MQPSQQQQSQPPSEPQRRVQTPFGEGVVLRSKAILNESDNNVITPYNHDDNTTFSALKPSTNIVIMREIQLVWKAKLFSPNEFPSIPLQVGQDVVCHFGRGTILELREASSSVTTKKGNEETQAAVSTSSSSSPANVVVVVQLSSWRLAHRSRVYLYLQPNAIQAVVRAKQPWEMNIYEKVEYAQHVKETQANPLFQQQQYAAAWQAYMQAVHVVKYVQHDAQSNNEVRADLIVLMITCCNNAALCAMHLANAEQPSSVMATPTNATTTTTTTTHNSHKFWEQVYSLANQALALLDALYSKRGMKIHSVLTKPSSSNASTTTFSDAKLFGEWRVKSLVLMAKALVYDQLEYDSAMILLKRAHDVLVEYTTSDTTNSKDAAVLQRQDKDVRRLLAFAKDKKRDIKAKEREWAKAMFASPPSASQSPAAGKKETASSASRKTTSTSPLPGEKKKGLSDNNDEEEEKKDAASPNLNGSKVKAAAATAAAHEKKVSFAPDVSFHHTESSSSTHSRGMGKNKKIPSENDDDQYDNDNEEEEDEEDSFLVQHQEALMLGSVLLFGIFAVRSLLFRHR